MSKYYHIHPDATLPIRVINQTVNAKLDTRSRMRPFVQLFGFAGRKQNFGTAYLTLRAILLRFGDKIKGRTPPVSQQHFQLGKALGLW